MNRKIIHLATLTLIGFPLIGALILWLAGGPPFIEMFKVTTPLLFQLPIGIAVGAFSGWGAWIIVRSPWMEPVRSKYTDLIGQLRLSPWQIVYISLCAGIGEEILFRGVIQPYLGVWITAILFVAIHGYLNPMNNRLFMYGLYMTMVIALIGFMTDLLGLYSAIIAHTVIDIILLQKMSKFERAETNDNEHSFTGEDRV